ncbi:hypothetical protein [Acidocella sp.]|nr:hypothetical protein [Acidocella sp.]MDD2795564.1 hypothetical protein [Acidocella sp.]
MAETVMPNLGRACFQQIDEDKFFNAPQPQHAVTQTFRRMEGGYAVAEK